ncbi:peptide ABC transporter substrate-binding protein [Bacillus testis]|uniref:peptide ABC transporter substrate-binding protein n=1 Tax=Bacillus testis TaxID=1622072 RepID=UPI00067F0B8E|nr:peptide ABC transporter substrate-binding protein [Bacillus testis]
MMLQKKPWSLIVVLMALMVTMAACSSYSSNGNGKNGKETGGSKKEQVLNLTANDIATLNSLGSYEAGSTVVMSNIFEGLYRLDEESKPVEGIAESHDVSDDQKKYTFHLRKNAKWSNGTPVTAHDFEYAWKKAVGAETLSPFSFLMAQIKNASAIQTPSDPLYNKPDKLGVKATDDYTLEVELDNPTPYFLSLVTIPVYYPQNKEFVEAQGDQYALGTDKIIYNGPFILNNWKQGTSWTYKKNPDYWDAKNVKLETINATVLKETSTAVNMYEAGQLDAVGVTAEFVDQYKSSDEFSTHLDSTIYFIRMNQQNKNLANVNIRKALYIGWDKQGLEKILNDGSVPAGYVVPKEFVFDEEGNDFRSKYESFNKTDIDQAVEYWNKGLEELGVDKMTLEFLSYDAESTKTVAQYVKNQWEKNLPGLTININQQPNKQKLELETKQEYELTYSGWVPIYQDAITLLEIFHSENAYNWMNFSNPKVDALIDSSYSEADTKKRWNNLQEAEKIILEDLAGVSPMFQNGTAILQKPYVKGIARHTYGTGVSYKWAYIE